MIYKIFINETPLFLTNTEGVLDVWKNDDKSLVTSYLGKKKFLHPIIDLLEKSKKYNQIVLHTDNLDQLWNDFQSIYKIIEAAGGVVKNTKNDVLMIFRRDNWDLPKGKIDRGESPEQAAVREIQEETGLKKVELGDFLCHTYHTYEMKGKRILKKTWWYTMSTPEMTLTPQTSEDIEQAVWVELTSFLDTKPTIYGSILDVLGCVTK
ncbi:MAG: NUDIX hydrolase [Saprospiraceae bacterium]|nr:NUDIX hydrolase [Saprospiraceae bacterium]